MLESLTIEGFRCFERFEIPELRRVNLFVGRNNAGKSTVLEAAGLLIGGGRPSILALITRDRNDAAGEARPPRAALAPLFRGWMAQRGTTLLVSGLIGGKQKFINYTIGPVSDLPRHSRKGLHGSVGPDLSLRVQRDGSGLNTYVAPVAQGQVFFDALSDAEMDALAEESLGKEFAFIGVNREGRSDLAQAWDVIAANPEESQVIDAMQILEPQLDRIVFTGASAEAAPEVFAAIRGISGRVPFSSLGEGSWRLLGLALYLAAVSPSGVLLIDEIDTGLHHTTMVKVWKLILTVARQRDLQIFATSHSQDCLRAMAELHAQEPELTGDFMLHYVSKDEPRARSFTAAEVQTAIEHDLELRG